MPKVNNPGCGCCTPPCAYECPDASLVDLQEVEWDVTLPNYIEFWALRYYGGSAYRWYKYETTGWAAFNGTYVVTKRTTPTCGWNYPAPEQTTIALTEYTYAAELLFDPGDPVGYICPTGDYGFDVYNIDYNAVTSTGETGWSARITTPIGVIHGLVRYAANDPFGLPAWYGPFFLGYGTGPNNNTPCEEAELTWNVFDRFPVDARCSGTFTNHQATATLTPTIV